MISGHEHIAVQFSEGRIYHARLTARLSFRTESSLAFLLERHSKRLLPTRQVGWIDLHYPSDGHIKLQIRISLPSEYYNAEKFRMIVEAVITSTGVPADETYEALLFAASGAMQMLRSVNREGLTDRLYANSVPAVVKESF